MAHGVTSCHDALRVSLCSGPKRGGGGVRGRTVRQWTPLGRPGRGCPRLSGMGWGSSALPAAPTVAAVAGKETDRLCVAGDRSSPCPGRRSGAGHGTGAGGGAAAITAQPLPSGSSQLPRWQRDPSPLPSAVVSGLYPGTVCPQDTGVATALAGVLLPLYFVEASTQALGQIAARVYSPCILSFSGVSGCFFLFLSPSPCSVVQVLPNRKSSPSTLSSLNPPLLSCFDGKYSIRTIKRFLSAH